MANISSAEGRFIFEKAFVEKHGDLIQNWIDKHQSSYYGFDLLDDKLNSDGSIAFYANGRWAYCWTLQGEGIGWTNDDPETLKRLRPEEIASREAVKALAKALADEKSEVRVEYTDYEPGCEVFYEAHTKLFYEDEKEFEVTEEYENDLDYDLDTICGKGFECAAYDFKNVGSLKEFKEFLEGEYADRLKECGLTAEAFANKVAAVALASEYRCGIVLEYEAEDWDILYDLAEEPNDTEVTEKTA